jgi:hypothetical protein
MGLLPTGTADWLAFETRGPVRVLLAFHSFQPVTPLNSLRKYHYSRSEHVNTRFHVFYRENLTSSCNMNAY